MRASFCIYTHIYMCVTMSPVNEVKSNAHENKALEDEER